MPVTLTQLFKAGSSATVLLMQSVAMVCIKCGHQVQEVYLDQNEYSKLHDSYQQHTLQQPAGDAKEMPTKHVYHLTQCSRPAEIN